MSAAPRRQPKAPRLGLTDTTFRDGNQTLLGGRLDTEEIVPIAALMDGVGFHAMEAFGGATFETHLADGSDPWEYLRRLNEATPKTPIQALVRGQNLVAHHNFPDDVVQLFISHAAELGVDVFRFFDPLNDLRNMEVAIAAAKKAGRRVQGALCYAISPAHDLQLWCSLAKGLAQQGVDEVVIKDTSGLLSPQATWELVTALVDTVKLPVIVHSHCSSGMAPMAYMAGIEAGAAAVDTALSPLAWGASQPATESVVAALHGGDYDTGIDLELLTAARERLQEVKERHREDLSPVADRVDADILRFQVPGLMLQDVYAQLDSNGASSRLGEVLAEIGRVREELGWPPLVSPIRGIVASQAVYNVIGGSRYATVTQELKDYLQGLYGRPPVPADPEVRRLVLGREEPITLRPADLLEPMVEQARARVKKRGGEVSDDRVLIQLLFPEHAAALDAGKRAPKAEASSPPDGEVPERSEGGGEPEAPPTADAVTSPASGEDPRVSEFEVEVEGQVFKVRVSGGGAGVAGPRPAAGPNAAEGGGPAPAAGAITAPMQGLIVKIPVNVGDEVKLGDVVAVLEAMKMQNDITTSVAGSVKAIYVKEGEVVSPNQALVSVA
ncbi:MAG TPA: pyruvate carboxylase subunit B [Candidatus Dormibacteraeota bacterium]